MTELLKVILFYHFYSVFTSIPFLESESTFTRSGFILRWIIISNITMAAFQPLPDIK